MAEGQGQPAGPERCRVGWGGTEGNQSARDHMGGHQAAHHREVLKEWKRVFHATESANIAFSKSA